MDNPELTLQERLSKAVEEITAIQEKYGLKLAVDAKINLVEVVPEPVIEVPPSGILVPA